MPIPFQSGTPTLIPNFYTAVVNARGGLDVRTPAQMATDSGRTNATASVTVAGTITAGDTATITLTQAQIPNGAVSYVHTIVTSENAQTVAAALASGLNAALTSAGVPAIATVGTTTFASEAVVTVNWNGPAGNKAVLTASKTGAVTVTVAPVGGVLSGGTGVVFVSSNFNFAYRGSTLSFYYGKAYQVDAGLLAALVTAKAPVV